MARNTYYARKHSKKQSDVKPVPKPIKRYVNKVVAKNVETKFINNTLVSAGFNSVSNAWTELDLTAIAQGTGLAGRIGHEVRLKAFNLRGVLVGGQSNLATDDNRNSFRIVVALWDATTATPLASNGATIDSYIAPETTVSRGLVKKFVDKLIILPVVGRDSTGYIPSKIIVRIFKKLRGVIKYYGSAATNDTRKLIVSMISDSSAMSHPGFVNGYLSFFYEDA